MDRRIWLQAGAAALCIIGGAGAFAQGADPLKDAKLIAAAKAEGKLNYYGSSSLVALRSDADAFKKAYGIDVAVTQLPSGPLTARVDQEIRGGRMQADVLISADRHSLYRWIADNQVAKLPNVKFPDRTDYLAQVQGVYQGIFFNTADVPAADVPKTWNDLLNPRFSGKIVIGSPRISPAYSELYYTLWKDPKYGEAYFQKLAAQKPRIVQNNPLVAQLVAAGEADIGFTGLPYDAVNVKKANPNAKIDYRYLDITTLAPSFIAVNAKAEHPNAARLFAAWMLSPAGQEAHNGNGRATSLLPNIPGTLGAPAAKTIRGDITPEKVSPDYQALIALFDRLFR
jgi:iron(III) transport system substrate-binding protein